MHDSMMSHHGMEQERRNDYDRNIGNEGWVQVDSYNQQTQQSPLLNGYDGFQYIQPVSAHGLPGDSAYSRMPPPTTTNGSISTQPQLLPLLMPSHHPTWPSMLTNPAGYQAPMAIPSAPAPLKTTKLPSLQTSTPRKTLTDDDRRRMCQYHEAHPNTKQIDIGAMFGVERSTVSKVLRQKEKYLFPEDRALSPVKRQKGKFPDIDRALSQWVRNSQKQGIPLTDATIQEKALLFASTVGNLDSKSKASSASWLEKFKQKNGIGNGKLLRRASETNVSEASFNLDSALASASNTPNGVSPTSPSEDLASPLSLSASKSQENMKSEGLDCYFDQLPGAQEYRQANSQSTTSLSSAFTDTAPSSFSGGATSPSEPYSFSPETACTPFISSQQSRIPTPNSNSFQQRPRSQTFPMLGIDPSYISPPQTVEPVTPKYTHNGTTVASVLETNLEDSMPPPFGPLDCTVPSPQLHHRSSAGSMIQGSTISPATNSTPNSPTSDDARAALHTLISYFSAPQIYDQDAYMTVIRLTEKLGLQNGIPGPSEPMKEQSFSQAPKMEHTMSAEC